MSQQTTPTTSKQFSVNMIDIMKGLAVAVLTPVFSLMLTSLEAGSFTFDWKIIGTVAASSFLAYILKNFLTPARIVITDKDQVEAVKEGDAKVQVVNK